MYEKHIPTDEEKLAAKVFREKLRAQIKEIEYRNALDRKIDEQIARDNRRIDNEIRAWRRKRAEEEAEIERQIALEVYMRNDTLQSLICVAFFIFTITVILIWVTC